MDEIAIRKRHLRAEARERRAGLTPGPVDGERLAAAALSIPQLAAGPKVAAFESMPGEPDTGPLLEALIRRGIRVLVPHFDPAVPGRLGWLAAPASAASRAVALGETALADVAAILLPAFAVDDAGTRLGRGGGWYDRALRHRAKGAPAFAVLHPSEVCEAGVRLPREAHDISVDGWITVEGAHVISR